MMFEENESGREFDVPQARADMNIFPQTLKKTSTVSLQHGLSQTIRDAIRQGHFAPGQSMPSSHELADFLSISRSTVVKVYRHLISEGYLEARSGSGTYVNRNQRPETLLRDLTDKQAGDEFDPSADDNLNDENVDDFVSSRRAARSIDFSPRAGTGSISNAALPSPELLPFKQWCRNLLRQCRPSAIREGCSDQHPFGSRTLRETIASYLERTKSVRCTAKQVIVFAGRQSALYFASLLFMEQGDKVVLENPCHAGDIAHFEARGAVLSRIDVDADGMQVSRLGTAGEGAKLVYVSPSHSSVTGAALSMDRRKALLAWAVKQGTQILEDASDSDFHYTQPPFPSLQGLDGAGVVTYLYSLSKALEPMVTTAFLVVPEHLVDECLALKETFGESVSFVEQAALAAFIEQRHLDRHICSARAAYRHKRQMLIFHLGQQFRTAVHIPNYSGGLEQAVTFNFSGQESVILQAARQTGLPVYSSHDRYCSDAPKMEFVMPFSNLSLDTVHEQVKQFASIVISELELTAPAPASAHAPVAPVQFSPVLQIAHDSVFSSRPARLQARQISNF